MSKMQPTHPEQSPIQEFEAAPELHQILKDLIESGLHE